MLFSSIDLFYYMLVLIWKSKSAVRIQKSGGGQLICSIPVATPPFNRFAIVCNAATQRRQAV